jgi:hypothetical protein
MNRDKLLKYSVFAGTYILLHDVANAEIIYTNINPDTIFDSNNEGAFFDIDNNGTFDFTVLNWSLTFTTPLYSKLFEYEVVFAVPYAPENFLAGNSFEYYYGPIYFPYALDENTLINEKLNWINSPLQILGFHLSINNNPNLCNYCNWYGEFIAESIDKYLGLKFADSEGLYHYGWIRCDVKDLGRTLVVKDYAYETIPNKSIVTGDTTSTDIEVFNNNNVCSFYIYNNELYVSFIEQNNFEFEINIYSLDGKLIANYKNISESEFTLDLNWLQSGIYLINISNGKFSTSSTINIL